jgi:hypothetical protein
MHYAEEEIIMSIGEWICKVMESTVSQGFYEEAINSLKYLLGDGKLGQPVMPSPEDFEEMAKECAFLSGIQLNAEDEAKAYQEPSDYHLTDSFSLRQYILSQIKLHSFYR